MRLFGEISSARGFNADQLNAYWAGNTFLQVAFPEKSVEEQQNASANLVKIGLTKQDFQGLAQQFLRMSINDKKDWKNLQEVGVSIEQFVTWMRAPSVESAVTLEKKIATRQELLEGWENGYNRAHAIRVQGHYLRAKTSVGALAGVAVGLTALTLTAAGAGMGQPDIQQTGQVFMEFAKKAWSPIKEMDLQGWGKNLFAMVSGVVAMLGVNNLRASNNKNIADGKQVNLREKLSSEHFQDRALMEQLQAIPKPFAPLLSHLSTEDLVLFLKGDDPLRASILRTNPPDHGQRHQFACLSSKWAARWMKQLDVSVLDWDNPRSDTGSQVVLSQLRKQRNQRLQNQEGSLAVPSPVRSPGL